MRPPFSRIPLMICLALIAGISGVRAELATETMPSVESLSADYPESLIFAHDVNFNALIAGRVVLIDVAPETHNYKGALDASPVLPSPPCVTSCMSPRHSILVARGVREPMS